MCERVMHVCRWNVHLRRNRSVSWASRSRARLYDTEVWEQSPSEGRQVIDSWCSHASLRHNVFCQSPRFDSRHRHSLLTPQLYAYTNVIKYEINTRSFVENKVRKYTRKRVYMKRWVQCFMLQNDHRYNTLRCNQWLFSQNVLATREAVWYI